MGYRLERFGRENVCIYLINARGEYTQWGAEKMLDAVVIQLSDADGVSDFSPWKAPRINSKGADFASGADAYLEKLMGEILDIERENDLAPRTRLLSGYSLADLFALYATLKTEAFDSAVSLSGSLWYEGWTDYLRSVPVSSRLKRVYLSLGDRKPKTRNPFLARVGTGTEGTRRILMERGVNVTFEWNRGGHFTGVSDRIARGRCTLCEG